jgi:glycosyltransferase involved in cell wall biosynthesis
VIQDWSNRLNLTIINSKGMGISNALNTGINVSGASYIFRIDDDDLMAPNRIRIQIEEMEKRRPSLAILGSGILKIDSTGNLVSTYSFPAEDNEIKSMTKYGNPFAHSAICIRASLIKNSFEYRSFYEPAEDFDLWSRILDSYEGANLTEFLTSYRVHFNQISSVNQYRQLIAREAVIESQRLRRLGQTELNLIYGDLDEWYNDATRGPSRFKKFKLGKEYFIRTKCANRSLFRILLGFFILIFDNQQFRSRVVKQFELFK